MKGCRVIDKTPPASAGMVMGRPANLTPLAGRFATPRGRQERAVRHRTRTFHLRYSLSELCSSNNITCRADFQLAADASEWREDAAKLGNLPPSLTRQNGIWLSVGIRNLRVAQDFPKGQLLIGADLRGETCVRLVSTGGGSQECR